MVTRRPAAVARFVAFGGVLVPVTQTVLAASGGPSAGLPAPPRTSPPSSAGMVPSSSMGEHQPHFEGRSRPRVMESSVMIRYLVIAGLLSPNLFVQAPYST